MLPVRGLAAVLLFGLAACVATPPAPTGSAAGLSTAGSAAPSTTGSTGPSVPPPSGPDASLAPGWTLVWPSSGDPEALINDVVATPDGFAAVGSDPNDTHSFALVSADGSAWTPEAIPERQFGPLRLIAWGHRLFAWAAGGLPCAHPYGLETWVRSTNDSWAEAPFLESLCGGESVDAVIVDDHVALVGTGPGDNAVAWSSADGLGWADHGAVFAGLLPQGATTDGSLAVAAGEGSAGLWTSKTADGRTWTAPAMIPGTQDGLVVRGAFWIDGQPSLVVSGDTTVGVVRPNGVGGWSIQASVGLKPDVLGAIRSDGAGLVALSGVDTATAAWVSSDGLVWRPVDLPEALRTTGAFVRALAVRDGRAVLTGSVVDRLGNPVSAIWIGPAALVQP